MPRVNIYIRKDDYELWQAVKDKPLLISNAIRDSKGGWLQETIREYDKAIESGTIKEPDSPLCKHNMVKGACGYASCKR